MQKILYVEDDLSLIDGLPYSERTPMIYFCWMLRSQMAQASMFAKRYGTAQPFPLYF